MPDPTNLLGFNNVKNALSAYKIYQNNNHLSAIPTPAPTPEAEAEADHETGLCIPTVRSVRMGGAECTEDGRIGATGYAGENGTRERTEVRDEVRGKGEMRNVSRRGERLGLSLCAVPSPRRIWGSFNLRTEQSLRNNEGIVSGVMTQARKRIRTEY